MIFKHAELYNVVETVPAADGKGWRLYRHPLHLLTKLADQGNGAAMPFGPAGGGVEIRFIMAEHSQCRISLCMEDGAQALAEIYQGPFFYKQVMIGPETVAIPIEYSGGFSSFEVYKNRAQKSGVIYDAAMVRVLLPNWPVVRLVNIEGDIMPPGNGHAPARRILFYGSSITHGLLSQRPSGSYAATLATMLGVDSLNLAIPGGCFVEPEMADYLASRNDWDVMVCELGVNILESVEATEFRKRVDYFFQTLGRAHGDKPVFCTDIYPSFYDPDQHEKLDVFRKHVRESAAKCDHAKIHYVPAKEILRTFGGLTVDMLHPGPDGMMEMAGNWHTQISQKIFPGPAPRLNPAPAPSG